MLWEEFHPGDFVFNPKTNLAFVVAEVQTFEALNLRFACIRKAECIQLTGLGHYKHETLINNERREELTELLAEYVDIVRPDYNMEYSDMDVPGAEAVFQPLTPEAAKRIVAKIREKYEREPERPLVYPVSGDGTEGYRPRTGGRGGTAARARRVNENDKIAAMEAYLRVQEAAKLLETTNADSSGSTPS